ncbi:MAG: hypothetical protein U0174_07285 [Polyangiaceae bacterium]
MTARRSRSPIARGGLVLFAMWFCGGLPQACSALDNTVDCRALCSRYSDCYDETYDIAMCERRCRTRSLGDHTFRTKADVCEACMDDESCTRRTFRCQTDCAHIAP